VKAILIAAGCALVLWFIVRSLRIVARDKASRRCFEKTYSDSAPMPVLSIGSRYGFPTFEVEFPDKAALDAASRDGTNARFIEGIGLVWSDWGTRAKPFDARKAIEFGFQEPPR